MRNAIAHGSRTYNCDIFHSMRFVVSKYTDLHSSKNLIFERRNRFLHLGHHMRKAF
jgi:hypothetical protein